MDKKDSNIISIILTSDQSHTLYSEKFKATYHSIHGAVQESMHVFIKHGLQYYLEKNLVKQLSVLEVGFGTGLNTFLTYINTKDVDVMIDYHTIEAYPITLADALKLNYASDFLRTDKFYFEKIHQQDWNSITNVTDKFCLTKHLSLLESFDVNQKFDLIYFDAFSPVEQPELWTESIFKKMHDLLNPNGVLVTYCAQGQMKRNMKRVGFSLESLPGPPGKREMTRSLNVVEP